MKTWRALALAAALATAAGCSSDNKKTADAAPADGGVPSADGGTPGAEAGGNGNTDGGAASPDGPAQLTLVGWVSDLVQNHTTATAAPDTVEDKHVTDTSDPAAFDQLLGK